MLIRQLEFHGVVTPCHLIGRFAVSPCCGENYRVWHIPSQRGIMCGVTMEEGLALADVLSTYALKDPCSADRNDFWPDMGSDLERWFLGPYSPTNGSAQQQWLDFYSLAHGYRPHPLNASVEDSAILEALSL